MRTEFRTIDVEPVTLKDQTVIEEYPIPVAEDWDRIVEKSDKLAEVIDKHLDFEERLQGMEMGPVRLCPEQRVSLVSDLEGVVT